MDTWCRNIFRGSFCFSSPKICVSLLWTTEPNASLMSATTKYTFKWRSGGTSFDGRSDVATFERCWTLFDWCWRVTSFDFLLCMTLFDRCSDVTPLDCLSSRMSFECLSSWTSFDRWWCVMFDCCSWGMSFEWQSDVTPFERCSCATPWRRIRRKNSDQVR